MSIMAKPLDGSRCHFVWSHIPLDGDPAPPKGHNPSIFGLCLLWTISPWIKMPLGTDMVVVSVSTSRSRDGLETYQRLSRSRIDENCQRRGLISVSAIHVSCPSLGTEIDFSPGHIVLDGDTALPSKRGTAGPVFGPCLLWPYGRPSQLLLSACYTIWKI